eukprot:GHRR01011019.1.p1 GENE.GHRR01011019.1~~GHRR01011019.1.p1  ORF type:complete len:456 (+),score=156.94 GHRR01011019.1:1169-2536(+)
MEASEQQIRAFCETMGEVYQLRLPKNPDGRNKGFGFVVYHTKDAAENAVQHLNAQELPDHPGRKIRASKSEVKNRLFIGNLPRSMTQHQLEEELKKEVVGLEETELMMDKENPDINRGFAFTTFYNYACAEAARRKYTEVEKTIGGRPVTVTWAEPKKEEDTSKVKAVYVGGLPDTVSEDKLRDIFKAYGEVEKVMLPYSKDDPTKYRDYGFVHFKERSSALQAIAQCDETKPVLDGKELVVALAKPQHEQHQSGGGYGSSRGSYGQQGGYGYGQQGGYGSGGFGRGAGRGAGGYGRGGGRYGSSGGRGRYGGYGGRGYGGSYEEDYGEDTYGGDDGYGGGGSGYGASTGYGAAAAAPVAASATMMMPVQLPNGQVGYMVVPAGTTAAGAGGPMRRSVAAGYGAAGYGVAATGYGAAGGTGYGARSAAGYASSRGSTGYGSRSGANGAGYRSHPY